MVLIQTGGVVVLFAALRILYRVRLQAPERLIEAE